MLLAALVLALPCQEEPPGLIVPRGFAVDLVVTAPEIRWPSAVHCLDDGSLLVAEDPMDMVGPADQPIDRILRLAFEAPAEEVEPPEEPEDENAFMEGWGAVEDESGGEVEPDEETPAELTGPSLDTPPGYTTTVFADGLYAVFGIESIGEEVFVVNMPHLTRLVDADGDGVAEQRDVLVQGLGPRPPGMVGGFNDHAISGLSQGLDGFLYISVGDKGIPLASGTDGSQLSLRGGGVVRVRPDGSRLELVATGTRNHLDVVLDESGEMFTFDNTDDGLGWWTRLTHVIEDGHYGYPFDYLEHPERMLPCMTDYGGGAPAGGLCYREAAWPPRFQGSSFWCEWGKGVIRRFDFVRDEATFRVDLEEDFVSAEEGVEFRPLDLCLSPDGRFMYVADWGHSGWQANEVTGSIWRIRREGDDPKVPSALREVPMTAEGWIDELGADSMRLRQRAQRSLVAMSNDRVREGLIDVLAVNPGERRRRHALWALTQIGGDRSREAIEQALRYPNEDTRIQALRALRRRGRKLPEEVQRMLTDGPFHVRREAATTIGYLGGAVDAARLVRALQHEDDPWVRWAIRRGLRRIGIWDERVLSWLNFISDAQEELLLALWEVYDLAAVERLAWFAGGTGGDWLPGWSERLSPARARAVEMLASVHRKTEPWDGRWWLTQPAKGPPPRKTVDWEGTPVAREAIRAALGDPSREVRRAGLEALRSSGDREGLALVRARYDLEEDVELRRLGLDVLGDLRDAEAVELLVRIVRDRGADAEDKDLAVATASRIGTPSMHSFLLDVVREDALRVETLAGAIESFGALGTDSAAALLEERLTHPREELRVAALRGLVDLRGREAEPQVLAALDDEAIVMQREGVRLAGELALESALPDLLELYVDVAVREEVYRALVRMPDPRALDIFIAGLDEVSTRETSWQGLRQLREYALPILEERHRAGELREPRLGEVRSLYREPRPVLDWRIAGPYFRGSAAPAFEGEIFLQTLDGEGAREPVSRPLWRGHHADPVNGFVDLDELLGSETNREAWATASFPLARAGPVELVLGSDDSMAVWLDGELVHDYPGARAWASDQDRVPLVLEAGEHEIVLRIGQGVGDWAFSFALVGNEDSVLFRDSGLAGDARSISAYQEYVASHEGDIGSGYRLFQNSRRLACLRCHVITTATGRIGDRVGPDLDGIGARYSREEIATSILEPSRQIASGYTAERVWTNDARQFEGQILRETWKGVILVDSSGEQQQIRAADIAGRRPMKASVMPDGYHALMTRQEFTDLVTFLESLGAGSDRSAEGSEEEGEPGDG